MSFDGWLMSSSPEELTGNPCPLLIAGNPVKLVGRIMGIILG